MARPTLHSRSTLRPLPSAAATPPTAEGQASPAEPTTRMGTGRAAAAAAEPPAPPAGPDQATPPRAGLRPWLARQERLCWLLAALLLAAVAGAPGWLARQAPPPLPLRAIDAALRDSLQREPLPAATAAAFAAIAPSVVRVVGHAEPAPKAGSARAAGPQKPPKPRAARPPAEGRAPAGPHGGSGNGGHDDEDDDDGGGGRSVGTGVVIVQSGLILTNLHVVRGADRIEVTFADGSRSEAVVVSQQPENDLAVLQARVLPDDLHPATLRSTQGLGPGDAVLAVGFPYGLGPSASAGVVSGLGRAFRSPHGQQIMGNLIQFDAAANPGNSGGPLVTLDGHVVGIVTAIMNPEGHSTFIGIGFAVPIENAAAAVGMPPF